MGEGGAVDAPAQPVGAGERQDADMGEWKMSMTKGTPASSQIIWLEQRVKKLDEEVERLREALDNLIGVTDSLAEISNLNIADDKLRVARAALQGDGE